MSVLRRPHTRISRSRRGDFRLSIPDQERIVLRGLADRLKELLETDDPALARLFPPAYPDDEKLDEEYRRLVRDDLVAGRMTAAEIMASTIDASRLDEEQMLAWLGALNDLRLILGTKLDVTEDLDPDDIPDWDPRASTYALYSYLGWLQEQAVEALSSGMDPPKPASL